eukprot:3941522-Rhodomonas_salina.5
MESLNRRFPSRGALEGTQGAELKRALHQLLPYALDRIDGTSLSASYEERARRNQVHFNPVPVQSVPDMRFLGFDT